MKKLFIAIILSTVLFFGLPSHTAKASDWVLPFSSMEYIYDLFQTIMAGGTVTFEEIAAGIPILDQVVQYVQDEKNSRTLGGILLKDTYNKILDNYNDLVRQNITQVSQNDSFVVPASVNDIAAFTRYDLYWYNTFKSDSIEINPNVDYLNYISIINNVGSYGFNWKNFVQGAGAIVPNWTLNLNANEHSWFTFSDTITAYPNNNPYQQTNNLCASTGIVTANFNSSTNTLVFSPFNWASNIVTINGVSYNSVAFSIQNYDNLYINPSNSNFMLSSAHYNPTNWTSSYTFSSLAEGLNFLQLRCRNLNIYVDGVCWALAGEQPTDYLTAPDVIQLGDTGLETYDVYGLDQVDDLGVDLVTFGSWLLDEIENGNYDISIEDVIEDEVPLVKTRDGTRVITDDDAIAIEKAIRNRTPKYDPEDPSPTPTNEIDPFWPKFPIYDPTWNPGTGSTVLSEIIAATDQTVPSELMTVIWSCFGLLVVGGLITILHK